MQFIKTTLFGGLFVLFPILLLYLGMVEIAGVLIAMAEPIADLFPKDTFEKINLPGVIAAILIVAASFILGLVARLQFMSRIGGAIEHGVLERIPMYRMLKRLSASFLDADTSGVTPAMIRNDDGSKDPCYVIERHDDGHATVLLPWSPTSFAGSVKVVDESRLHALDCSLDRFSQALSLMGVGVEECMKRQ